MLTCPKTNQPINQQLNIKRKWLIEPTVDNLKLALYHILRVVEVLVLQVQVLSFHFNLTKILSDHN